MSTLCIGRAGPSRPSRLTPSRPALPALSGETRGVLLGLTAAAIWGAYMAFARAGIGSGLGAPDLAFLRYGISGLVMLPWLLRHRPLALAGVGWRRGAVLALLAGPLFVLATVGGYGFAPLAHGAVLQPAVLTVASMVLAALLLGDRPTAARVAGVAVILGGLAVIAGPALLAGDALTPVGDALFAAAGLMWAAFAVLARRWGIGALPATAAVSVLSAAAYLPAYLALGEPGRLLAVAPGMLAAQVLIQGLLSGIVAVIAFSKAVQLLGAGRAAAFPALVPAVAILLGIPVAGEVPTLPQAAGLGLVSLGLLVALGVLRLRYAAVSRARRLAG